MSSPSNPTQFRKFIVALVIGAVCAGIALLTQKTSADVPQASSKNEVLRVGVFLDYPPFGSLSPSLEEQGYDIELAKIIAKELSMEAKLVQISGDNRIPMLTSKKVDLLMSVGKSPEREKVIDFAQAYAPYYLAVFGTKTVSVKKSADLAGKTLSVTRGTLEDTTISEEAPSSTTIKRFDEPNGAIAAFVSGQVPLLVVGNDVGANIMAQNPKLSMEQKYQLFSSPSHIAVDKGNTELKNKIDVVLSKLKQDGTLNELSLKWLKAPLPADLK